MSPRRLLTSDAPNPSETRPILLIARAPTSRSTATMPEDSWPRCCSEYSPRWVIAAAWSSPKIPKIPHILVGRHRRELVKGCMLDRFRHDGRNGRVGCPPQNRQRTAERSPGKCDVRRLRATLHSANL